MSGAAVPDLDLRIAMRHGVTRLEREFEGVIGRETVDEYLHSSWAHLQAHSRLPNFLPLLAERFARQRLAALAKVEGLHDSGTTTVLFLDQHNAGRSQMAMAFADHFGRERLASWSGGQHPHRDVEPAVLQAMSEVGLDLSGEFPKPWTDEVLAAADLVITLGCEPPVVSVPVHDWAVPDPTGMSLSDIRPIRDNLRHRVENLVSELVA